MSWNGERLELVGDKNNRVTVTDGRTKERKKGRFGKEEVERDPREHSRWGTYQLACTKEVVPCVR